MGVYEYFSIYCIIKSWEDFMLDNLVDNRKLEKYNEHITRLEDLFKSVVIVGNYEEYRLAPCLMLFNFIDLLRGVTILDSNHMVTSGNIIIRSMFEILLDFLYCETDRKLYLRFGEYQDVNRVLLYKSVPQNIKDKDIINKIRMNLNDIDPDKMISEVTDTDYMVAIPVSDSKASGVAIWSKDFFIDMMEEERKADESLEDAESNDYDSDDSYDDSDTYDSDDSYDDSSYDDTSSDDDGEPATATGSGHWGGGIAE